MDPERLQAEWLRLPDLPGAERDSLGVSWRAVQLSGGLAATTVATTGMTWRPSESSERCIILPVFIPATPTIYIAVENPIMTDMVTFAAADPEHWYWRTRQAYVLGRPAFDHALAAGVPIVLYGDILSWLRADCTGSVILDFPATREAA